MPFCTFQTFFSIELLPFNIASLISKAITIPQLAMPFVSVVAIRTLVASSNFTRVFFTSSVAMKALFVSSIAFKKNLFLLLPTKILMFRLLPLKPSFCFLLLAEIPMFALLTSELLQPLMPSKVPKLPLSSSKLPRFHLAKSEDCGCSVAIRNLHVSAGAIFNTAIPLLPSEHFLFPISPHRIFVMPA